MPAEATSSPAAPPSVPGTRDRLIAAMTDALRRRGFHGVGVADILQHELEDTENLDHLFSPERLAHIDRAAAQMDAGLGIPAQQVREHFQQKRDA